MTRTPESRAARPAADADAQLEVQRALLDGARFVRREALAQVDTRPAAGRFAVRHALLLDRDADVRAAAAERLGRMSRAGLTAAERAQALDWLGDACADGAPVVREAALRALGRLGGGDVGEPLRARVAQAAAGDPVWWVRRAASLSLGVLSGRAAIAPLLARLADPFWRVRHAALQALYVLGTAFPDEQARMTAREPDLSEVEAAARLYLRARFSPEISVHKFAPPAPPDAALWNADPAVVTARLRAQPASEIDPLALLPLLGDPHEPLRTLAARHVRTLGGLPVLRAALRYLETPAMPHAAETVAELLDGAGPRARALAAEVLADPASAPGAVAWAAQWAVSTRSEELYDAVRARSGDAAPGTRFAVACALGEIRPLADADTAILTAQLADGDEDVRTAAALALAPVLSAAGPAADAVFAALASRPLPALHPAVRALLLGRAAQRGELAPLQQAAADPHEHPRVRARALTELARRGALPADQARAHAGSEDPWLRAAVLPALPAAWAACIAADPDARVRRLACRRALARHRHLDPALRAAVARAACTSADPWLRAAGAALLDVTQAGDLALTLALLRDPDAAVRVAAADLVTDADALAGPLHALLTAPDALTPAQRAAAYTLLLRKLDAPAAQRIDRALADPAEPPAVRAELRALSCLFPAALRSARPHLARAAAEVAAEAASPPPAAPPRPLRTPDAAPRRPLGRTGLLVSPLGLSGANDLPESALRRAHEAGVNLFFWEPGYRALTRFLRRHVTAHPARRADAVLVAGSYEGDRFGIERDVARALARLRTDHLDVFLLFWTRSTERLSDEAHACLRALKQAGKIRAFGLSTHLRDLAEQAIDSGDWDVVMTRHSAAHPGAEARVFPRAAARGVGILSFSALCYGRMLQRDPADPASVPPTATECYRYSLSQPGVSACWSAPRRRSELLENLDALTAPALDAAAQARLRAHGAHVRADNREFDALVRKGHEGNQQGVGPAAQDVLPARAKDAAPALLALLDASAGAPEPAPEDARTDHAPQRASVAAPLAAPRPRGLS